METNSPGAPSPVLDVDERIEAIRRLAEAPVKKEQPSLDLFESLREQLSHLRDPISDSKGQGDIAFRKDVRAHVIRAQLVVLQHVHDHIAEMGELLLQSVGEVATDLRTLRDDDYEAWRREKQINHDLTQRIARLESRWYERLSFWLWEFVSQLFRAKIAPLTTTCDLCGDRFPKGNPDGHGYGECVDVPPGMFEKGIRYDLASKPDESSTISIISAENGDLVTLDCEHCVKLFRESTSEGEESLEGTIGEEILDHLYHTGHFPSCPILKLQAESNERAAARCSLHGDLEPCQKPHPDPAD